MALSGCAPQIHSVEPAYGLPGAIVTIEGKHFAKAPHDNLVTIGGANTRVISGDEESLRVVALRDVASGAVVVEANGRAGTSPEPWERAGSTLRPTPLRDADAKLVEGLGYPMDKRYDMAAQGTDQRVLVILAAPSDVDPEALAPPGGTALDDVASKLPNVNRFFEEASYGKTSADFGITSDWVPLSQPRDFYFWTDEDVDRAQTEVDSSQAALDAVLLDPDATEAQLEEATEALDDAKAQLARPVESET